jgi:hypothetical protein
VQEAEAQTKEKEAQLADVEQSSLMAVVEAYADCESGAQRLSSKIYLSLLPSRSRAAFDTVISPL